MQRTNIYLDDAQIEALDRLASARGVSRAELVRNLIDRALHGDERDLASDLAAIEATCGAITDEIVLQRGEDARSRHLDEIWRQ
jgi:metal-responsive CopG/Arc/MetJ family transcriptional regulator